MPKEGKSDLAAMLAFSGPVAAWICLLALVVSPFTASAQMAGSGATRAMIDEQLSGLPSGESGINQIMGDLEKRLTLTAEQKTGIRPIVTQMVGDMEKLRDRFNAGELNPMAFGMQLQMATQKSGVLIEPHLDETQAVEYGKMRQEQRRMMMEEMRKRTAGAASTP